MTVMERLIDVEGMEDEMVYSKFKTGKNNVKKVLKVLLFDELRDEMEKEDKPPRQRKPRDKKEKPDETVTT
ncbi:MAG: hypothetical protein PQJ61_12290 [Spirochaetales bacterium]|uniref:Uncharacterized protein n=1 Tax=Candidatus Thalassospirochaeta sargassi TaxID=3119039 RepID=A0AAJ1IHV4_9SPIO|nr:hypothetical protein [Spirochaetales bacterium]